jgi:hypothetical protein
MDALIAPPARPSVDRRAIFAVFVVTAFVTVMAFGATRLFGGGSTARPSVHARDALLALATKQQQATWFVQYDFERVLTNGQKLSQRSTEANRPPAHVTASGGTVTVDFGKKTASCTATSGSAHCTESPTDPSLAPAEVYRVVTSIGAYSVAELNDRTIAGERVSCFRLRATRTTTLPSLGPRTDLCFAADGVPMFSEMTTASATDTRVAVSVQRKVTNAMLDGVLHQLDQK